MYLSPSHFVVAFLTLLPLTTTQQDPTTPTPYHPGVETGLRSSDFSASFSVDSAVATNTESDTNDDDSPTDASDTPQNDNVVYVSPDDYNADDANLAGNQVFGAKYPNGFSPNDLGSASELYRILALGPQQTDPEMDLGKFSQLLGRMNPRMNERLDNIDHCPERPEIGIQYYCMKLEDGMYHDPWNPWCGFIRCSEGVAERVCCKQGTWLGMVNLLQASQQDMCRKPLNPAQLQGDRCPIPNTSDLCRAAKKVEKMNPPKKKLELPLGHFPEFTARNPALSATNPAGEQYLSAVASQDKQTDNMADGSQQ